MAKWQGWLWLMLVVAAVGVVFWPVKSLGWTNWDDPIYVTENPLVTQGDYAGCLTTPVVGGYTPLPLLSFTWDWQQQAAETPLAARARRFHIHNWVLYLFLAALAYAWLRAMGLRAHWSALSGLLFALHPMRVESVAWVTERKDLLYAIFFLGTLLTYLRWRRDGKVLWLALVWACFVMALLSKVQAVTLPLVLLVMDLWLGRKVGWGLLRDKWGMLLLSAGFGVLGLVLASDVAMPSTYKAPGLVAQFLWGLASIGEMALHWLLPLRQSVLYPIPGMDSPWLYLEALLGLSVLLAPVLLWRRLPKLSLVLAFVAVNVVMVTMFGQHSDAYAVDRLWLTPSLGLCLGIGWALQNIGERKVSLGMGMGVLGGVICLVYSYQTRVAIGAWKDAVSLWTHVIEGYPNVMWQPYTYRGSALSSGENVAAALEDLDLAIRMWPEQPAAMVNRGAIYARMGRFGEARLDFDMAISLYSLADRREGGAMILYQALRNRASVLVQLGRPDLAEADFKAVLRMQPLDGQARQLLGRLYVVSGRLEEALVEYDALISQRPSDVEALAERGRLYLTMGRAAEARTDFEHGLTLDPRHINCYLGRAYAGLALGDRAGAHSDALQAQRLGAALPEDLRLALGI